MTRYLVAADADKIQDLLFGSARLREVAGGSRMLSRFCEASGALWEKREGGKSGREFLICSGGGWRVLFDDEDEAARFGPWLSELYSRFLGGSLTWTPPVPCDDGKFAAAAQAAEIALRKAKNNRPSRRSDPHMPHLAFCASCGAGIAESYAKLYGDDRGQTICAACARKAGEWKKRSQRKAFFAPLVERLGEAAEIGELQFPGEPNKEGDTPEDPGSDLAKFDRRSYVAYILADGNDMGKLFARCESPEQMKNLSKGLDGAVWKSLAEPIRLYRRNQKSAMEKHGYEFVPMLPLIAGGDDVLAMVPAPWALDFAKTFCLAYEKEMERALVKAEIPVGQDPPTMSAAAVICKKGHPYAMAHACGKALLSEAKVLSRRLARKGEKRTSCVSFALVVGDSLHRAEQEGKGPRPTLKPYLVEDRGAGWGPCVEELLEQRYELRNLPRTRLAALRRIFEAVCDESSGKPWQDLWNSHWNTIAEQLEPTQRDAVAKALESLGSEDDGRKNWALPLERGDGLTWTGHGLPDLLEAWEFSHRLDKPMEEYDAREED